MHVRQHLPDFVRFGISYGRHGELLCNGRILRPDQRLGYWPGYYVDPDDGILKDRVWFWRDRGEIAPARRKDLNWARPHR